MHCLTPASMHQLYLIMLQEPVAWQKLQLMVLLMADSTCLG